MTTTEQVRQAYQYRYGGVSPIWHDTSPEFDAWLAEHDRHVAGAVVSEALRHPVVKALLAGQPVLRGTLQDIGYDMAEGKLSIPA